MLPLLCLGGGAVAQSFGYEKELSEAKSFLASRGVDTCIVRLDAVHFGEGNEMVLFNNQNYFVLVATREYFDCLDTPVLAYSVDGGFKEEELVYDNLFLLHGYASQLRFIKEMGLRPASELYPHGKEMVQPLLGEMAWGTGTPYNKFCPHHSSMPDKKTQASSLGVAMVQIMKYHKYPSVGRGKFSYKSKMSGSIDYEKLACNWENTLDRYDGAATDEEINMAARLVTATSVSVGTRFDYTKSLSSIDYARKALVNHFKYSPQCMLLQDLAAEKMVRRAYDELVVGRPLIYTLYLPLYGTHSVVCDGFDRDFLHLNMGMSGTANGYYRILCHADLPILVNAAIVGIEPDRNTDSVKEVVVKKAGTLPQLLSEKEKVNLRKLKVKGKLGNKDVALLRRMAGADGQVGNLMELDLSEAKFVTDKDSCFLRKSALGYRASGILTTYRVTNNYRGYYTKTPLDSKRYSYDFYNMDEKKWKELRSMGLDKGEGYYFTKNGAGYYINLHTQKGLVGEEMFINCLNLRRLVLPEGVKSVGKRAFKDCHLLEEIVADKKTMGAKPSVLDDVYSYGENAKIVAPTDVYNYVRRKVDAVGEKAKKNAVVKDVSREEGRDVNVVDVPAAGEAEDNSPILSVVEERPQFPNGGDMAMLRYLESHIKYPKECVEKCVQGRVIVQFVVNKDGTIVDPEVIKPVNPLLDEEAIRVIKEMPKWIPGKQKGKPVRVRFTIPVTFSL